MEEYEMTPEEKADEMVHVVEKALELIVNFSDFRRDRKYPFKLYGSDGKAQRGYVQVVLEEER